MEGKIVAVIYKTTDDIEVRIAVSDESVYENDNGEMIISLDWKEIALHHALYLQHLREENRIRPEEATPPEYNENS